MSIMTDEELDEQIELYQQLEEKNKDDLKLFSDDLVSTLENKDNDNTTEALLKALQDKEFVEETSSLLKMLWDGEPANKNPLTEIPNSEMRLYHIDDNYFESIDELLHYCRINNKSTKGLKILDYYREFAGRSDVIRNQDCDTIMFYTAVDEDGYGMYNNERSIYRGEFTWEYNYGSIQEMYKPFRDRGIVFEDDIYGKIAERNRKIYKMYMKKTKEAQF